MDELVKRLRCSKYGSCPACPMWYSEEVEPNLWRERCATIDAADAIEELLQKTQQMPRWIPVTERLPKKTGVYLAWMKWDLTEPEEEPSAYPIEYDAEEEAFGWWKSYYDAETLGWAGEDFIRYEGITHWMPLPQPPKEET